MKAINNRAEQCQAPSGEYQKGLRSPYYYPYHRQERKDNKSTKTPSFVLASELLQDEKDRCYESLDKKSKILPVTGIRIWEAGATAGCSRKVLTLRSVCAVAGQEGANSNSKPCADALNGIQGPNSASVNLRALTNISKFSATEQAEVSTTCDAEDGLLTL